MKRRGIIHADLMCEITMLRHTDQCVVCDVGYPIPKDAKVIDLSLVKGVPSLPQVLGALLSEIVVEGYMVAKEMQLSNPEYYSMVHALFSKQKAEECTMDEFIERAKDARFYIRTGESKPYSNIILISASGVPENEARYVVEMNQDI